MRTVALAASVVSTMLVGGCVTMPTEPMVPAMVGSQKTTHEFQTDDGACRAAAQAGASGGSGQAGASEPAAKSWFASDYASGNYALQRQFDAAYLQCMYARGHRVPAPFVQQDAAQRYSLPGYPPPDYPAPVIAPSASAPAAR